MLRRFFLAEPVRDELVELGDAQAHHLLHVMRASVGDRVVLFDGTGLEYMAQVQQLGRRDVLLRITSQQAVDREPARAVTLAVAMPKGDRQDWLVQKATELGVKRLIPWVCQRSVATAKATAKAAASTKRWQRIVIEASKQCHRTRLMTVDRPLPFAAVVQGQSEPLRLLAAPRRDHLDPVVADAFLPLRQALEQPNNPVAPVVIGIGPEGGWTDDELRLAVDQNWRLIGLGDRILRTETAAIAAAAYVLLSDHA